MEYLDGELLGARLQRLGALGQPMTLNLGRQIASALAAAHHKGIVHRDLKPDNIMIVSDPETVDGERVKVFDFGLAKLRLTSLSPNADQAGGFQTQSGVVLGTSTHISPEQCRGASDVDGKADVYSLGVIFFEMLIGHPPFVAESVGELISMHLRDRPPSLRKLDKTIAAQLSDLVQAMLSKEPALRPEMTDIVQQLEALGAHRTRRGAAPPAEEEVKPPAQSDIEFAKTRLAEAPIPSQATGQSVNPLGGRQYLIAVGAAAALVLVSAAALFSDFWPDSAPPPPKPTPVVTWMIDSEPQGAELLLADSNAVLGHTPWYRSAAAHDGTLRINVRLPGYRDSTVLLNQGVPSN